MRGPSSSHCAAALRIGRIARDLMKCNIEKVLIEFDKNGSLATTHKSQGSDMGLFGGLLGLNADDAELINSETAIVEAGIKFEIQIHAIGAIHPNTYKLTLTNSLIQHQMIAVSLGGGMIEIIELDGIPISMQGDYFETIIYTKKDGKNIQDAILNKQLADEVLLYKGNGFEIVEIKSQNFLAKSIKAEILKLENVLNLKEINPVLPILSSKSTTVPFITCEEMNEFNQEIKWPIWKLAQYYESQRGNITEEVVFEKMKKIVQIIKKSINKGLTGTDYKDRILGFQSGNFLEKENQNKLLNGGLLNIIVPYVTAMMEVKSSMGIIIAAPTAGACATLPGTCVAIAKEMKLSEDDIAKAMLAASMIGIFIAAHSTFAAEVGGCQAEGGSASAMTAAALVSVMNGTTEQATSAASMAIQNMLGLICDPVANRVEVPCLGKNIMAASNALCCANMSLSNFDKVIPLDEVIDTMNKVGESLPSELCCTALGGLSITKTSKEMEKRLA
ncbi:MAG: L-serine ammonia-lyase, iron-sulfur-dependent, subunit alpha [Ignavibacteria bacterium]|nr:L-serine ammonia-lyase, iron-sulfur-dependent, subunit alpha [Ignavibacteria bacterium]MBT8383169.1 L-serine ammonia-lyase, iron-sulfur-dependent, subunit alpha [Ignavibacteria bacterium]MBT8391611.1 L-serine ammonia-lyase, iron-sulfur-dependent, subunit alpha [Ignavibacteria bacterium]NNL20623.1 serine dehydratase [Ignavibacteriaceae bacterium]